MRQPTWVLLLSLITWVSPSLAQETLRYDLSQTPLEYAVSVVQDAEVPLPDSSSQVRTAIKARMRWTAESEREDGSRVVRLRFRDFQTTVTTGARDAESYEYLDSLAPFDIVFTMTSRGEVHGMIGDTTNPARQRALVTFQDLFVGGFVLLAKEPVRPGSTWKTDASGEVDDEGTEARSVIERVFLLESQGVVGFSSTGTLDSTIEVDGKKISRRIRVISEGSARFRDGILMYQSSTWTASSPKTDLLGATKLRTTVRLRREK